MKQGGCDKHIWDSPREWECPLCLARERDSLRASVTERDAEIERLKLETVECHIRRDILQTLAEAMEKLPICTTLAIMGGSMQEIDALRGMNSEKDARIAELVIGLVDADYLEFQIASDLEAALIDGGISPDNYVVKNRDHLRMLIDNALLSTPTGAKERIEKEVWENAAEECDKLC